jgi:potassium efflux system protein
VRGLPASAVALAILAGWLGAASPSRAQEVPAGATPAATSEALEELRAQLARVEESAAQWEAKAAEYETARLEAPARLQQLEQEIARLEAAAPPPIDQGLPADQIELRVLAAEQELALAQRDVTELSAELDRRSERRRELPDLLAYARARLAALAPTPVTGTDPESQALREQLDAARRTVLEREMRALEEELASYDARGQLLDRRIAHARLRVTRGEAELEGVRTGLARGRALEGERELERARDTLRAAESLGPAGRDVVKRLAEENVQLALDRYGEQGLLGSIADVSRKLGNVERRLAEIDADFERLTHKIGASGLTGSVGVMLRKTRSQAPDVGLYRRYIRMRQGEIAAVEARQEALREERSALADIDALVALTLQRVGDELTEEERAGIGSLVRDLLETRRKHVEALLADYELYFQKLVDFDSRQQELIEKTERLLRFIDQWILWIPSGDALRPQVVSDALAALAWLGAPHLWGQLGRALADALRANLLLNLAVLLLGIGAVAIARSGPARLRSFADTASRNTQTDVAPTLLALLLSAVLAAWLPAAFAYVGWRLSISPDATQFVRCVAHGLLGASLIWLTLELPRQILRRDGLAVAHFAWPAPAVAALRRDLTWLTAVAVPLVFVIQTLEMRGEEAWRESAGRISLIAALAAATVFIHRVIRPSGALRELLRATGQLRLAAWQWSALHVAALAVPIGLAAAAARGYYWTALQLGAGHHLTLVFLFLLFALLHLALRWSLLARRRLAFDQLRQQAEEAKRAPGADEAPAIEPELDLATVDAQTGRLLSTSALVAMVLGLWFLWADLVPAVDLLDAVELWSTVETRTVETRAADGTVSFQTEQVAVPITLGSLLIALLIGFMALVLVRNLPGLLEISLFRRLGTGPGERYAIASIAKYALSLLGAVLAFSTLGVGWSNIQWLVAAVGLGLGFGLQEIFANFISGLIILFERPIRVGDTVTVGDVSGTVSKIRIRATWITAFDRKELVVPNKEFVTSRLVNWSLSDPILRVDIKVGIAYGSDTAAAMRELLAVANANELVLKTPKPDVYFLGFGDSTLDFELRCFSPDVDSRIKIVHALHLAIDTAFRAAGIEIAFPQRDVHIRSAPPGWGGGSEP